MYVEYISNNSGGSWWLSDDNWEALESILGKSGKIFIIEDN